MFENIASALSQVDIHQRVVLLVKFIYKIYSFSLKVSMKSSKHLVFQVMKKKTICIEHWKVLFFTECLSIPWGFDLKILYESQEHLNSNRLKLCHVFYRNLYSSLIFIVFWFSNMDIIWWGHYIYIYTIWRIYGHFEAISYICVKHLRGLFLFRHTILITST